MVLTISRPSRGPLRPAAIRSRSGLPWMLFQFHRMPDTVHLFRTDSRARSVSPIQTIKISMKVLGISDNAIWLDVHSRNALGLERSFAIETFGGFQKPTDPSASRRAARAKSHHQDMLDQVSCAPQCLLPHYS